LPYHATSHATTLTHLLYFFTQSFSRRSITAQQQTVSRITSVTHLFHHSSTLRCRFDSFETWSKLLLASGLSHQHNDDNNLFQIPQNTTRLVAMAAVGNLDRTLESIAKDRKPARNNKPRRAVPARTAKATVATSKGPSNGIQKAKAGKPTKVVAAPAKRGGESKIQVSGLPEDVSDAMLKVC
jgi:hypothetical protein